METFKIILNQQFEKGTLLKDHIEQRRLKVSSEVTHIYGKWYHKLLNKITLGCRFQEAWSHEVESIPFLVSGGINGFDKKK